MVILVILALVQLAKHAFIPAVALVIVALIAYNYISNFQKEMKYNISLWNKYVPDDIFFYIDNNSGKIFLTGAEIPFCDVKEIRINVADQPKLIGKSKKIFEKAFVNANVEIITSTKSFTTPIQTKQGIKDLEEFFKDMNLNTILDVKLYNI